MKTKQQEIKGLLVPNFPHLNADIIHKIRVNLGFFLYYHLQNYCNRNNNVATIDHISTAIDHSSTSSSRVYTQVFTTQSTRRSSQRRSSTQVASMMLRLQSSRRCSGFTPGSSTLEIAITSSVFTHVSN